MPLAEIYSARTAACHHFFRDYRGAPFAIRGPGWSWQSSRTAEPFFTLVINTVDAWDNLLHNPTELSVAEAFIAGQMDVEGDIFSVFDLAACITAHRPNLAERLLLGSRRVCRKLADRVLRGTVHSRKRDSADIAYHYDQPVEFYAPWLGPTMLYSSAYFRRPDDSLETAQIQKLDLICRKLDLHPGEQFLDIGCGWGSLALHAAQRYEAKARGITLSRKQAQTGAARIMQARVSDQCFVEVRDYRDAAELPFRYDKIASIGMFEHVGVHGLSNYFRSVFNLIKPGGVFLNSGIVRSAQCTGPTDAFIDRYVFPDGELPTLSRAVEAAESAGWEVRDVDCLSRHYAHTLRLWVQGLRAHRPELRSIVEERTFRIWLLYMAGSAVAFERGDIAVYQLLLRRPSGKADRDLTTREPWYRDWEAGATRIAA